MPSPLTPAIRAEHQRAMEAADKCLELLRALTNDHQRTWAAASIMTELEADSRGFVVAVATLIERLTTTPTGN